MQPPAHLDGLERLAWYRAARASEEERAEVENIMRRTEAGERLAPHEEAKIAYNGRRVRGSVRRGSKG